jgi:hypothetical protein
MNNPANLALALPVMICLLADQSSAGLARVLFAHVTKSRPRNASYRGTIAGDKLKIGGFCLIINVHNGQYPIVALNGNAVMCLRNSECHVNFGQGTERLSHPADSDVPSDIGNGLHNNVSDQKKSEGAHDVSCRNESLQNMASAFSYTIVSVAGRSNPFSTASFTASSRRKPVRASEDLRSFSLAI